MAIGLCACLEGGYRGMTEPAETGWPTDAFGLFVKRWSRPYERRTMLRMTFRWLVLVVLAAVGMGSAFAETHSFVSGSLTQIEKAHLGRPFLLMVWSLDCSSCLRELDLLAAQAKRHPEMALIMVSTDELSRQSGVEQMLAKRGLVSNCVSSR